jgi:hypothetical protein
MHEEAVWIGDDWARTRTRYLTYINPASYLYTIPFDNDIKVGVRDGNKIGKNNWQ